MASITDCTNLIAAKGGGTVANDMNSIRVYIFNNIQGGSYINNLQGQYDAISSWTPGGGGGGKGSYGY
jgi:hypothetical protein